MSTVTKIVTTTVQCQEITFKPAATFVASESSMMSASTSAWTSVPYNEELFSPTALDRARMNEEKQYISSSQQQITQMASTSVNPTPITTPRKRRPTITPLHLETLHGASSHDNKSPNQNSDPTSHFSANSIAQGPTPPISVRQDYAPKTDLENAIDLMTSQERIEAIFSICAVNDPSIKTNKPHQLRQLVTENVNNIAWQLGADLARLTLQNQQAQAIQTTVNRVLSLGIERQTPITKDYVTSLVKEFIAAYNRVSGVAPASSSNCSCSSCVIM